MLEFFVEGQSLRRGDRERLVAGSVGFVEFSLRFDPSWDGYTKTALFRNTAEEDTYCVFGVEHGGRYTLPHEVLKAGSEVEVCIFGAGENASCATVNSVRIPVEPTLSAGELKESLQPSPSLFEQICSLLRDTLRGLPGKNLMLKADEGMLWWKSREDKLWEPLVSMDSLRGKDGTRWFSSEESALSAAEGDYLVLAQGDVFRREGGEWRLIAPLGSALRRAEKAADEVQRLTESPNLFPEAFELWNGSGGIFAALGEPIAPCVMEPMATYRLPVSPGKSYAFTATPADYLCLAVTDRDGICLELRQESVDSLELPFRYGGAVPAYLYYVVRNLNEAGEVFFCEKGIGALEARLRKAEKEQKGLSNALKGKKEGAALSLSDVSPMEHTLKVGVRSKNLFDVSTQLEGKWVRPGTGEIGTYAEFNTSDYIAIRPNTVFTINYVRQGAFYDENKGYISDMESGTVTTQRTYTMPANAHYVRFSYQNKKASGDMVQLELGTEVGAYTPFVDVSSATLLVNGESYHPEADGTVEGVKSQYPTTTLMTDTEGVMIEAEYNRDLNKAYQALADAIKALGGAV